jgi:hypothetical protein
MDKADTELKSLISLDTRTTAQEKRLGQLLNWIKATAVPMQITHK